MIFLYVLYYFIVNSNDISMVDEKTHPNYLSLLLYVIYYIIRAFGTHNVMYYVLEQGHVIWIRFFIHHIFVTSTLLQYGSILLFWKYTTYDIEIVRTILKKIDLISLDVSLISFIIFIVIFWSTQLS